jgi:predicted ATPase
VTSTVLASNRFRIRRKLGEGGTGAVFEAEDALTRSVVALKTLRGGDGEALYRFKREFRIVAGLAPHPNLVRLGELFCEAGQWFFTMELVIGKPLSEYVRAGPGSERPFDEQRLRGAFVQLAEGLRALHDAGQVHRDVKPSNVIVSTEGRVVLLDFGLLTGEHLGESSTEPTVLGTAAYMAPEQTRLDRVGPEADAYAVGVMLFEALTGTLPFGGAPLALMREKEQRPAPAPSHIVEALPTDLDALCVELLERDPALRPTLANVISRFSGQVTDAVVPASVDLREDGRAPQPFVGRARELRLLDEAFAALDRDGAAAVLIEGEPGVGKTALVENFLHNARSAKPDNVVLAGRCYEQEFLPFKAFDGAVDAVTHYLKRLSAVEAAMLLPSGIHYLASLFPVLRRVPVVARAVPPRRPVENPGPLRARAFEAFIELLEAIALKAPLILFIDDLQWIDEDSLELLEALRRKEGRCHGLLVAAMRSTSSASPTPAARLRALFRPLKLGGLSPKESAELIAALSPDTLSTARTDTLIHDSGGHPLFLSELARAGEGVPLHLEELLRRRIATLDEPDQRLLEVAAVAGVPLPYESLARAAGVDSADCLAQITPLRAERFVSVIVSGEEHLVGLFHDRVREALLGRLEADADARARRQRIHLALGRTLLNAASESGLDDDSLFAIVHHLQQSAALIESATERRRLVSLSIRAARLAKLATAYEAALRYIRAAEALLDTDAGEHRFSLQKARIEVEYLLGHTESALSRFKAALAGSRSDDERVELYVLLVEMQTGSAKFAEAIASARQGLRLVGVRLPERPGPASILRELVILRYRQGRRTLADLANMPESRDGRMRCAMQLLMATGPACYFADRVLMSVVLLKMANLSMRHGSTAHSAFGFVGYGLVMSGAFGQYQKGFDLGRLGTRLDERLGTGELEAKLHMIAGAFMTPWVRPYAEARAQLRRAQEAGLRIGDLAYRTYAAIGETFVVELGGLVDEIVSSTTAAIDIARRNRDFDQMMQAEIRLRAYRCLHELRTDPVSLSSDSQTEAVLRGQLSDEKTSTAIAVYFGSKSMICYLFGAYEEAWYHATEMARREDFLFSVPTLVTYTLTRVLIGAQLVGRPASSVNQAHLRRVIKSGLARLRKWAVACPEKFAAMHALAHTEALRSLARHGDLEHHYRAALEDARRHDQPRIEAMTLELVAQYFEACGKGVKAERSLRDAIAAYERWGAHGKAEHLRRSHGRARSGLLN